LRLFVLYHSPAYSKGGADAFNNFKSFNSLEKSEGLKSLYWCGFQKVHAGRTVCFCGKNSMLLREEQYAFAGRTVCFWLLGYVIYIRKH